MEKENEFNTYRQNYSLLNLLKETFSSRREKNSAYSHTSFARDLGISKSMLSRVFSGDRPISLKLGMQIIAALDVKEPESNMFLYNIVQSSSENSKISKKIRKQLENAQETIESADKSVYFTSIEIERFKAMSQWYHLAILNLSTLENFKKDPQWIAEALGISSIEASSALDRLFSLGLLSEKEGEIKRTVKSLYVKTSKSEFAIRNFHMQMIDKARIELKKSDSISFSKRLINGITFTCDDEHRELIKDKINKLEDEILNLVATGENKHLYQMNIQFFPLTDNTGE